jgi:hypothetical protein
MSEKIHQSSHSQYQIRIDGVPKYYPHAMDSGALKTFSDLCQENPKCYVDIIRINFEIVMCQFDYHQMKNHFSNQLETK